ncbi:MAG: glutamate--cysteine ligase [Bdellovibrionales bacterium]|nr:glutamate--cysteine ligase [Bdellovibrionales bacterium]
MKSQIHRNIVENFEIVKRWFKDQEGGLQFPLYMSFDIRDSGKKVVPVDANLFPAGFNNICATDKESAIELVGEYLDTHFPGQCKGIVLVTEEHTKNAYYWENVYTLLTLIKEAGKDVRVTFPRPVSDSFEVESANGQRIKICTNEIVEGQFLVDGREASLIISNNDFSDDKSEWLKDVRIPVVPPHEMGWHVRRKDKFFSFYNSLAGEFSELIKLDPWVLSVKTESFPSFDIGDEENREKLAVKVDEFYKSLVVEHQKRDLHEDPFIYVKNSAGTYGLGVSMVRSGDDVRSWTYKSRKKMKAAKGGGGVSSLILQEGIPTSIVSEGSSAEPALYLVGDRLAGGFLRTHMQKGPQDSLNSPGAVFRRLCVSDLKINVEGHPMENVYGWVAKLGALAVAKEAKEAGVELKNYRCQ